MNVVDSSGWLEYLADGPNAGFFAGPLEAPGSLVVPTLSIYEVTKRIMAQRGEEPALQALALMRQGEVVDLDEDIALQAARASIETGLPMADSVMLATARARKATLWTQDKDFDGVEGVRYVPAKARRRRG